MVVHFHQEGATPCGDANAAAGASGDAGIATASLDMLKMAGGAV